MNTLKRTIWVACLGAALASPAPAADEAAISRLAWIAGHWCMDREGERIEEQWLAPQGGLLIGMGRTVAAGKARAFEFMRIEQLSGVPTLLAQPMGEPPVAFRLTRSGEGWAQFENPGHEFPKLVEYRRTAQGLHAHIAGPGKDGNERRIPFDYRDCGS
jgi:hypothetical protein